MRSRSHVVRLILTVGLLPLGCARNSAQTAAPKPSPEAGREGPGKLAARAESARAEPDVPTRGYRVRTPSRAWQDALKSHAERFQPDAVDFIAPVEMYFFPNPETVCEPDDRTQVATPQSPWDANCRLVITMQDGSVAVGTGWLLGPKLVVTAGHCVHEGEGGRFYRQIEVIPAANGAQRPFGSQVSQTLRASQAWQATGSLPDDYGAIILAAPFVVNGRSPSMHVTRVASDAELRVGEATVSGYPGDKPPATQWRDSDPFSHILPLRLRYPLDTYGGQSGSAVMHDGRAVGIHNYGGCPNYSTRITEAVDAQLRQWLAESSR